MPTCGKQEIRQWVVRDMLSILGNTLRVFKFVMYVSQVSYSALSEECLPTHISGRLTL